MQVEGSLVDGELNSRRRKEEEKEEGEEVRALIKCTPKSQ
jgi:hypothetical protein